MNEPTPTIPTGEVAVQTIQRLSEVLHRPLIPATYLMHGLTEPEQKTILKFIEESERRQAAARADLARKDPGWVRLLDLLGLDQDQE